MHAQDTAAVCTCTSKQSNCIFTSEKGHLYLQRFWTSFEVFLQSSIRGDYKVVVNSPPFQACCTEQSPLYAQPLMRSRVSACQLHVHGGFWESYWSTTTKRAQVLTTTLKCNQQAALATRLRQPHELFMSQPPLQFIMQKLHIILHLEGCTSNQP